MAFNPFPTPAGNHLESGEVSYASLNDAIWDVTACSEGAGNILQNLFCNWQRAGYARFGTPGAIITAAFPYLFSIAGLILFIMLVIGALEIMLGAGDPKSAESGQKRITTAVIGFLLLFASFWIIQILFTIFGLNSALVPVGPPIQGPMPPPTN